jgi:hypothetical protein
MDLTPCTKSHQKSPQGRGWLLDGNDYPDNFAMLVDRKQ